MNAASSASAPRAPALRALLVLLVILALTLIGFGFAQPAAAATVIYNLYATDAYVPLADGTAVYNYGFVGGRQGVPLTYAKSVTPDATVLSPTDLNINHASYTYVGNGYIATGAPAPTGGPITPAEQELAGNAQFPAPLIYASVGDVVEIRLKNLGTTVPTAPNDPHSIHLHGLDVDAANDGVPETSVAAVPANLPVSGAGNVVVYMFSPKAAGTYMYHCHQEADIHVQMGMYGALVVYNPKDAAAKTGPGSGVGGNLYGWNYDKDYVLLESEIGIPQHTSEEISADTYNPVDYHPSYWFLNGLSFPDTVHVGFPGGPNWADWIAAHPGYDPFITGSIGKRHTNPPSTPGDKVLIRMINMGYETQPMHMHGFHGKVIGSDQRAWSWANSPTSSAVWPTGTAFGKGLEKNTLTIGSGETYDWLINIGDQSTSIAKYAPGPTGASAGTASVTGSAFAGGSQTRYNATSGLPSSNTVIADPAIPDLGGVPYLAGPTVTGAQGLPTTGQLFPFHNHDDYKATNNGAYPGGMFTMIMATP